MTNGRRRPRQRRWRGADRERVMRQVIDRDGEACALCGLSLPFGGHSVTLDHRDPDGPHTVENARRLCRSCNAAKGRRYAENVTSNPPINSDMDSDSGEGAKRSHTHTHTHDGQNRPTPPNAFTPAIPPGLTYGAADATRRADWLYPRVRAYLAQIIALEGRIRRDHFEAEAAEDAGCSIQSVRREYLPRLTSRRGEWEIVTDDEGRQWIKAREGKR